MATSDREDFYPSAHKLTPEPYEPPRGHGCFFYGCIIASVMTLMFVGAVGIGFYVLYRAATRFVEQYTATAPRELPKVEMPPERRKTLQERVDAFRRAIESGTPAEPLILTADEVNALIEDSPNWKGKIYVSLEGDKVKGKVSIPLEKLSAALEKIGIGFLQGRYLNGEAELMASLRDGVPLVTLESLEVNGQQLPEEWMTELRKENVVKDAFKDPKNVELIRKLESIEIKDGKIIIKPRAKNAGAVGGTSEPLPDLPEDVLAPPGSNQPKAGPAAQEPAQKPWI
jgi:hypothetical protein